MGRIHKVTRSDGRITLVSSYDAAVSLLGDEGCSAIGHAGDLTEGGGQTLAWLAPEDAEDDPEISAYAAITRWFPTVEAST